MLKFKVLPWVEEETWETSYCFQQVAYAKYRPGLVLGQFFQVLNEEDVAPFLARFQCHGLYHLVHFGEKGWGQNLQKH